MRDSLRYIAAALALGGIGYAGSEAMFWSFPPQGITPMTWLATIVAYALAGACALSAVIWAGLAGWLAVFLGGAVLGFVVEGVIVSTMYDAFPFQLVWTPLAWHAALTGLAVLGLQQRMLGASVGGQVSAMLALGLGAGFFASYWPMERAVLPPPGQIFLYQAASGAVAVAGFWALGRIGRLPRPPSWVLAVLPVLAVGLWVLQGIADPRPQRLALPVMLGLTLWAMRRLGGGEAPAFIAAPLARQALFLVAPLTLACIAAFAVRGTAGFAANIIGSLLSGAVGLGLWLWLLWRALRSPGPVSRPAP